MLIRIFSTAWMRIIKEVGQSLCLINCIQISIFLCLTWNMTVYCDASTSIYEIPVRNYSPSKQFDWFRRHFYACTYGANWIILSHSWTLLVALLLTYIFFFNFLFGAGQCLPSGFVRSPNKKYYSKYTVLCCISVLDYFLFNYSPHSIYDF